MNRNLNRTAIRNRASEQEQPKRASFEIVPASFLAVFRTDW